MGTRSIVLILIVTFMVSGFMLLFSNSSHADEITPDLYDFQDYQRNLIKNEKKKYVPEDSSKLIMILNTVNSGREISSDQRINYIQELRGILLSKIRSVEKLEKEIDKAKSNSEVDTEKGSFEQPVELTNMKWQEEIDIYKADIKKIIKALEKLGVKDIDKPKSMEDIKRGAFTDNDVLIFTLTSISVAILSACCLLIVKRYRQ